MTFLLGALALGFMLARVRVAKGLQGIMPKVGSLALIVLLFSMGITLGANPELIASLPSLGLKAFLLSIGAILGSVLLVVLSLNVRRRVDDQQNSR